jgi:medium-chain acyl-[acyl-carrier-protein] hydrolase
LFCFPSAGAGASLYRHWSALLPADWEVCPVQLPGRETRFHESAFAHLSSLIDALSVALQPYLDKPFAFFGHSMGGMIAFELARKLRAQGSRLPVQLMVAATREPPFTPQEPIMHDLPRREFRESLRQLGGTTPEVLENEDLMEVFEPLLRADFAAVETHIYEPGAPLECPLSVYGGLEDNRCPRERLEGWRNHTTGVFRLRMFPGGHFFLSTTRESLLEAIVEDRRARSWA